MTVSIQTRFFALVCILVLMLPLAGCKSNSPDHASSSEPAPPAEFPVNIGDAVRIQKRPEKVVSLSPALTEWVYDFGLDSQLSGVSDYCDYPADVKALASFGTPTQPKVKELLALPADLVITSAPLAESDLIALQQRNIEVLVISHTNSIDQLWDNYLTLCRAFLGELSGPVKANEIIGEQKAALNAFVADSLPDDQKLTAIYLRITNLTMATGDTLEGAFLQQMGVQNAAAPYENWNYPEDKAVELEPDIIFADNHITMDNLTATSIYKTTTAVKNKRVLFVDGTAIERQGPRMFAEFKRMSEFLIVPAEESASAA